MCAEKSKKFKNFHKKCIKNALKNALKICKKSDKKVIKILRKKNIHKKSEIPQVGTKIGGKCEKMTKKSVFLKKVKKNMKKT